MDLSLEIENNASLTSCLKAFSATETLDREDKFSCDTCGCLQEAQKRMKVRRNDHIRTTRTAVVALSMVLFCCAGPCSKQSPLATLSIGLSGH